MKLKKEVFYYGKLGMSREEIKNWESDIIDQIMENENLEYQCTSYWKLAKYNSLLIKRDVEWWNKEALPKINQYWSDVLEHRKKPMDELQKLYKPRTWKKQIKNGKLDNFVKVDNPIKKNAGFLTDSDDED